MKTVNLFTALVLLLFFNNIQAQTPDWQWLRGGKGVGNQEGWAVAADRSGNVYETGFFWGDSMCFGNITIPGNTSFTIFLVKYSASGAVLWAKSSAFTGQPGTFRNGEIHIATDLQNNVYLTGFFNGGDSIAFDNTLLVNTHIDSGIFMNSSFIFKFDSAGNVLWAREPYWADAEPSGIATDTDGNAYIIGSFAGDSVTFGTCTLMGGNYGTSNFNFITKYSPSGSAIWARKFDAPYVANLGDGAIAIGKQRNVYVTGFFQCDSINVGGHILHQTDGHIYVAALDSGGSVLWAKVAGGQLVDEPFAIASDDIGNVYVTGAFWSPTISFGTYSLNSQSNNGLSPNFFLVKYDAAGHEQWARAGGAPGQSARGYSLATYANKYVYVAGSMFNGNPATSGANDSIILGTTILKAPGFPFDPMFLLTYDSTGHLLCASTLSSGGDDNNAVTVDPFGNAYVGGDFADSEFVVGSDTLLNKVNGELMFLAKFSCGKINTGITTITPTNTLSLHPNPSNGSVTISFTLPEGTSNKSLHITDFLGKEMNSYTLHDGQTEKQIDTRGMSSGIYLVSLIADGRVVAVQKMVVE